MKDKAIEEEDDGEETVALWDDMFKNFRAARAGQEQTFYREKQEMITKMESTKLQG